jgi:hypothetical protein
MKTTKTNLTAVGARRNFQSSTVSEETRLSMIAEAAYYIAQKRGFQGGDQVEDWYAAEKEIAERFGR